MLLGCPQLTTSSAGNVSVLSQLPAAGSDAHGGISAGECGACQSGS